MRPYLRVERWGPGQGASHPPGEEAEDPVEKQEGVFISLHPVVAPLRTEESWNQEATWAAQRGHVSRRGGSLLWMPAGRENPGPAGGWEEMPPTCWGTRGVNGVDEVRGVREGGTWVGHSGQLCPPGLMRGGREVKRRRWVCGRLPGGAGQWGRDPWEWGGGTRELSPLSLWWRWPTLPDFLGTLWHQHWKSCVPQSPGRLVTHADPYSLSADSRWQQRVGGPGGARGPDQVGKDGGKAKSPPGLLCFMRKHSKDTEKKTEINSTHTYIFITQINRP